MYYIQNKEKQMLATMFGEENLDALQYAFELGVNFAITKNIPGKKCALVQSMDGPKITVMKWPDVAETKSDPYNSVTLTEVERNKVKSLISDKIKHEHEYQKKCIEFLMIHDIILNKDKVYKGINKSKKRIKNLVELQHKIKHG